jgi:hypothetical protein
LNALYQVADTSSLNRPNEKVIYTLDGLKYANTLYDIRVYLRSPLAVGEDKWSAPTMNTFRTEPTSEYKDNLAVVGSPILYICCSFIALITVSL